MDAEWHKLRRAVVTDLPVIDPAVVTQAIDGVTPDRSGRHQWPASADRDALRALVALASLERNDADLYKILAQLSAFEWFGRLSETIAFAIACSMTAEGFFKSELAIVGSALKRSTTQLAGNGEGVGGELVDPNLTGSDEFFYIVAEGLLSVQYGRRVAGYLHPGELWASFSREGGKEQQLLEVRAVESSSVLVVTRALFMQAMSARSDAHFLSKLEFLKSVPLLASLERKALRPFVDRLTLETAHAGTVLLRQGDPPSKLYFVLSGEARVLRHVPETAFAKAAAAAAAASPLDELVEVRTLVEDTRGTGDEWILAAAGAEGGNTELASDTPRGPDPLAVAGRTLELRRMGKRDFFGGLNEVVGGRSLVSVVSEGDMRLLAIHMVDFKNLADAAMEAAFRQNARTYPTDVELVGSLSDGAHWRKYKRSLVARVLETHVAPKADSQIGQRPARHAVVKGPGAGDTRTRARFLCSKSDGLSTPIPRAALFDMAVQSARRAAAAVPPQHGGAPPMLLLPEIAVAVNNSASRGGILHAGSRAPPMASSRGHTGKVGSTLSAVDDVKQWEKFNEWGSSAGSRADYKARHAKHMVAMAGSRTEVRPP